MFANYFAGGRLLHLPQFALVLFMAVFAAVVGWTFFLRRGSDFDSQARLPFTGSDE